MPAVYPASGPVMSPMPPQASGPVSIPQPSVGRARTPEQAAGPISLLCYPESNYISGELLVCGGGFRI